MSPAPSLADWFPPGLVAARLPALGEWSPVPAPGESWPFDGATRARVLAEARSVLGEPWPALPASLFAR
ncbi:heparinase, partial [Streptomyces sp. SID11385]|nr:heparinase [Streptomyces sp. SID11385]